MLRFILNFFGGIFTFATLSIFGAALVLTGVIYTFGRDLPDAAPLNNYTPPTISRIYSTEGAIIDEFLEDRRLYAPLEDIPEVVQQAFISAEDKNFWEHAGFDLRGIAAAGYEAIESRGANLRGASTIPQQVAKILFFGNERRVERKIKEAVMANRMVNEIGREQILEIYLNEIDLGFRSFGVAAAAQTYFNKTLAELEPQDAAYLAALPKAPYDYHPVLQEERAITRRNFVLREMFQNGYLTEEEYDTARVAPLLTVQNNDFEAFRNKVAPRNYFTDEIRRQLSRDFGESGFKSAGLTIRATVDPEMQDVAEAALREALENYDREQGDWKGTGLEIEADKLVGGDAGQENWRTALAETRVPRDIDGWFPAVVLEMGETSARVGVEGWADGVDGHFITPADLNWIRGAKVARDILKVGDIIHVRHEGGEPDDPVFSLRQVPEVQGAFMAMDVNTGRVIAMQGGFSYQDSVFNRATQATRQPGSAFKPFVYAAALDSGFTPATIVVDAPIEVDVGGGEIWRPKNASNQYYGPTPLRTGIERSRNLMTIRLAQEVGMETVAAYAERFGVYDRMGRYLANTLGSEETTLFRMVAAYAMFANGGERVTPTLVDRVQDRWGTTIYRHDQRNCYGCDNPVLADGQPPEIISNRAQVMDPITAYQLTSMMKGVVERGTAAGAVNLGVPTAGKTGTTNDERDAWFVGYTSSIAAGCYIGFDNPRPMGRGEGGGRLCAPVFQSFMKEAIKKYGAGRFRIPPGGRFIKIDRFSGARLPDDASGDYVVAEYFREGEEPIFGVTYDGGFAMGANLPLFTPEQLGRQGQQVQTSTGRTVVIPKKATTGQISSGGLY